MEIIAPMKEGQREKAEELRKINEKILATVDLTQHDALQDARSLVLTIETMLKAWAQDNVSKRYVEIALPGNRIIKKRLKFDQMQEYLRSVQPSIDRAVELVENVEVPRGGDINANRLEEPQKALDGFIRVELYPEVKALVQEIAKIANEVRLRDTRVAQGLSQKRIQIKAERERKLRAKARANA